MSDLAYRISPSLQCLLLASSFDQNSFREPRAQLGDIVSEGAFLQFTSISEQASAAIDVGRKQYRPKQLK